MKNEYEKLKTATIGWDAADPAFTLCPGHVSTKTFNTAFLREGWRGLGWISKGELKHEYWKPWRRTWKRTTISDRFGQPFTVYVWDRPAIT